VVLGSAGRRLGARLAWRRAAGIAAALTAVLSLACVRYGQYRRMTSRSGTCEGACDHYLECKDDVPPDAAPRCVAECRDIYVYDGEVDEDSLLVFEGLDCKATIGFVEGTGQGRDPTATSGRRSKGRSQAH
jgi:hypothetical protein